MNISTSASIQDSATHDIFDKILKESRPAAASKTSALAIGIEYSDYSDDDGDDEMPTPRGESKVYSKTPLMVPPPKMLPPLVVQEVKMEVEAEGSAAHTALPVDPVGSATADFPKARVTPRTPRTQARAGA